MPRQALPAPLRRCASCGCLMARKRFNGTLEDMSAFLRRKYCDRQCMANSFEGQIKVLNEKNSRRQSGKAALSACERCGRSDSRLHVHHRDLDPLNNDPSNLVTLCGSCHRLAHSPNYDPITLQPKPCAHCSRPAVEIGLCASHLTRLRKHGDPCLTRKKIGSSWVLVREAGISHRSIL